MAGRFAYPFGHIDFQDLDSGKHLTAGSFVTVYLDRKIERFVFRIKNECPRIVFGRGIAGTTRKNENVLLRYRNFTTGILLVVVYFVEIHLGAALILPYSDKVVPVAHFPVRMEIARKPGNMQLAYDFRIRMHVEVNDEQGVRLAESDQKCLISDKPSGLEFFSRSNVFQTSDTTEVLVKRGECRIAIPISERRKYPEISFVFIHGILVDRPSFYHRGLHVPNVLPGMGNFGDGSKIVRSELFMANIHEFAFPLFFPVVRIDQIEILRRHVHFAAFQVSKEQRLGIRTIFLVDVDNREHVVIEVLNRLFQILFRVERAESLQRSSRSARGQRRFARKIVRIGFEFVP